MKNKFKVLLGLSALALLASCSGGNTPSDSSKPDSSAPASQEKESSAPASSATPASSQTPASSEEPASSVEPEPERYAITTANSDIVYLDGAPVEAEAGTEINFRVTLEPGYHFNDKVTVTAADGTAIDSTLVGIECSFTMPAAAVTVNVDYGTTDYTIKFDDEFITGVYDADGKAVESAVAGTELTFEANDSLDHSITDVQINGVSATKGEDGKYHFTMPYRPVVIDVLNVDRAYDLTVANAADLAVTSYVFYTDTVNKTPITTAVKGEVIYLDLTASTTPVYYEVTATTEGGDTVIVNTVTTDTTYSFTMVSDNILVNIAEDDWSKYAGIGLVDGTWKYKNIYTSSYSSSYSSTNLTYSSMNSNFVFQGNGHAIKDGSTTDYTFTLDDKNAPYGHGSYSYNYTGSIYYTYDFWYTPYIIVSPASSGSSSLSDMNFFMRETDVNGDAFTVQNILINASCRLFVVLDADSNILETDVCFNNVFYSNCTVEDTAGDAVIVYSADNFTAYTVYDAAGNELFEISSKSTMVATYNLTGDANLDGYGTMVFYDSENNEITQAKNGSAVTLVVTPDENLEEGITLDSVTASYKNSYGSTTSLTLTKVTTDDGTLKYTFTMPTADVTFKVKITNSHLFENNPALGSYIGTEFDSYSHSDSSALNSNASTCTVTTDGTITWGSYTYNTTSLTAYEEAEMGTFDAGYTTSYGSSYDYRFFYGGDMLVRPYYAYTNTYYSFDDVYVLVKVSDGVTASAISTQVYYAGEDDDVVIAAQFFISGTLAGSVFIADGVIFMNVTFDFDASSTRVGATSKFDVNRGTETLATFDNGTVTIA